MCMYKMRKLHIVLLENENVIAHLSEKHAKSDIFEECSQLYEFAKQNKPESLIETLTISSLYEIDFHVKTYMHSYGMDHVRGGTYIDPQLTNEQRIILEKEFAIVDIVHEQDKILKYIENNPQGNIHEKLALLDSLKYCSIQNKKYEISRETIRSIEWLQSTIEFSKTYAEYFKNNNGQIHMRYEPNTCSKYAHLIKVFKKLYEKVMILRDSIECDYPPYLENPEFIFDNFVYHISTPCAILENYEAAIYMVGRFEYMCYILINRIDELEFDIANP